MKWPQIIVVIVGVVTVAIAVRLRPQKPAPTPPPPPPVAPTVTEGRILSPSTEQPGVVSRLVGLLRTYVAVPEEIPLPRVGDAAEPTFTRIPILVVFENETYRPLLASEVGWLGGALGTVRVARVPDTGAEVEIFETELLLPSRVDWASSERRSFTVEWPVPSDSENVRAGLYKISLRLALPDQPVVEIYTRLL